MATSRQFLDRRRAATLALVCALGAIAAPGPGSAATGAAQPPYLMEARWGTTSPGFRVSALFAVTVTAPPAGSSVRGTTVQLSATADVLLTSVQFQRAAPGSSAWVNIGAADTLIPYEVTWNTTSAEDGAYDIRAVATDLLGAQSTSEPVAVTVDNTAPAGAVTTPTATSVRGVVDVSSDATDATSGVARVVFERSPAGAGSWAAIGTDTSAPYAVAFDTAGVTDGMYDLRAVSSDAAGNTGISALRTLRVDNTAPTAAVASPADGEILVGTATVSATAADGGSGVAQVRFEQSPVDEEQWVDIATDGMSPFEAEFNTSVLADGAYEVRAVAYDAAGNLVRSTSARVTLDNTLHAPSISFFDFTNAFVNDGVVYFREGTVGGFSVAAMPDEYADPAHLDFPVLGLGWSGGGTDTTPPYEMTYTFDATAGAIAGERSITIVENSGLRSPPSSFTVVPDGTPPTTTVECDGASCAAWYTRPVTVALRATDAGSGVAGTQYSFDGSTWIPYAGPFVVSAAATIRVRSTDALGNAEPESTVTIGIDSSPPTGVLTAPVAGTTLTGSTTLIAADASDVGGSGLQSVRFQARPVGATTHYNIATDTTPPYETTWNIGGLTAGEYEVHILVRDNAGNQFSSLAVPVTVAPGTTQPTTFSLSPGKPSASTSRGSAAIVVPVHATHATTLTTTLLKGKRRVFTWRSRIRGGSSRLKLSLPRRLLLPGRYVLAITARGPEGTVTRRVPLRTGRT